VFLVVFLEVFLEVLSAEKNAIKRHDTTKYL